MPTQEIIVTLIMAGLIATLIGAMQLYATLIDKRPSVTYGLLQRVKLLIVASKVILADPDIMSSDGHQINVPSSEPSENSYERAINSAVGHNDQSAKAIDSERQKVIIKLLVHKEPATATDVATLLGIRYQDALAGIRQTIASVKDE